LPHHRENDFLLLFFGQVFHIKAAVPGLFTPVFHKKAPAFGLNAKALHKKTQVFN
jgi:hypothetical protein